MQIASLPYIDEHATLIAAGADDVWRSLGETLDRSFSRPGVAGYARLVGSADCTASGPRPLAEGSTFPGFRVVAAVPGRELVLEGRHRFSSYALIFRLEHVSPGRSRLRAESRAAFPGRRHLPKARHRDRRARGWHAAPPLSNPPPIRVTHT
jgi:hypothetical protein